MPVNDNEVRAVLVRPIQAANEGWCDTAQNRVQKNSKDSRALEGMVLSISLAKDALGTAEDEARSVRLAACLSRLDDYKSGSLFAVDAVWSSAASTAPNNVISSDQVIAEYA